jgi:signal transduction histidine kinase
MSLRRKLGGIGRDLAGGWLLAAFLLIGVFLPTGCVLWFMNQAVQSQAESARRRVSEAYRGQLLLAGERVESFWKARAAALARDAGPWAPADFPHILRSSGADSALLLGANGGLAYPLPLRPLAPDPTLADERWRNAAVLERQRDSLMTAAVAYKRLADIDPDSQLGALAAQAQARCLVQSGGKPEAIAVILGFFSGRPEALDMYGRLIAADELLYALQLLDKSDRRYRSVLRQLTGWLNDYTVPLPPAQRMFLMTEVRTMAPGSAEFPTYRAERMAAELVEKGAIRPGAPALERDPGMGLWRLTGKGGRAIALYRDESVAGAMSELLADWRRANGPRFAVTAPGAVESDGSVAVGSIMPGWRVSVSFPDGEPFSESVRQRRSAYIWAGYLVAAAITLIGFLAGQALYRQRRLARLKSDLVAAVSHELKTPLSSMRLLVETLLEDGFRNEQAAREYLEMIAGENMRLSRLIDNFLTFSRMERNSGKFNFAETTAADVVEPALWSLRERQRASHCQVEVSIPATLPPLWADRDALVTVLLNLLDNALKYTGPDKRIELRASHEEGHVVFQVIDNGIGISPRDQKRIFRRFYRVDQRLARETQGCGLGLSIVEFIVSAHGGAVTVESRPGAGSTFSILLPCHAAAREVFA